MRRSAIHFYIALMCMVVGLMLGTIGRADDHRPASAAAAAPSLLLATSLDSPRQEQSPTELLFDLSKPAAVTVSTAAAPARVARGPRVITMEVTAYCPCSKCCGKGAHGVTASGLRVSHNNGRFVAADTSVLPFHTKLIIPGYAGEQKVEVLDRGGAIKGNRLDVYFPTHRQAIEWGRRKIDVIVTD